MDTGFTLRACVWRERGSQGRSTHCQVSSILFHLVLRGFFFSSRSWRWHDYRAQLKGCWQLPAFGARGLYMIDAHWWGRVSPFNPCWNTSRRGLTRDNGRLQLPLKVGWRRRIYRVAFKLTCGINFQALVINRGPQRNKEEKRIRFYVNKFMRLIYPIIDLDEPFFTASSTIMILIIKKKKKKVWNEQVRIHIYQLLPLIWL